MIRAGIATLAVCVVGLAALRVTVASPQTCPQITPESLAVSAAASADGAAAGA